MNTFELQHQLNGLGAGPLMEDNRLGPSTHGAVMKLLADRKVAGWASWLPSRRLVAAEQVIMATVGKLDVGAIDGLVGERTRLARVQWEAGNWRDALMAPSAGDARMPLPVRTVFPTQADVRKVYGEPGQNQALLQLPFAMRLSYDPNTEIRRFSIHEKVHDSAARVYGRVLSHYGEEEIHRLRLDLFGGCLNNRLMRGGKSLSMHAWGIAIDTDPDHNQLNWGRSRAAMAGPDYEAWFRFWTEEGWLSLGKARDFDWMHVQAARL